MNLWMVALHSYFYGCELSIGESYLICKYINKQSMQMHNKMYVHKIRCRVCGFVFGTILTFCECEFACTFVNPLFLTLF